MALDPRTPVLVAVGTAQQREDSPGSGVEAVELMVRAAEDAVRDSGSPGLAAAVDRVLVPRGTWRYSDPGRTVADRLGAKSARTTVADLGVLQQSLFTRACRDVLSGASDAVLVVGGEAAYRRLRSRIAGERASETVQETAPEEVWSPAADIIAPIEKDWGFAAPVRQYAAMETALRAAEGLSLEDHALEVGRLWEGFSAVAQGNPEAWRRDAVSAADLVSPAGKNAWLAAPYSKWHCSQMNVDQAAALVVCSVETAQRLGVARDRWVFPVAAAESNVMVPLVARRELHRSPGFRAVGDWLTGQGLAPADQGLVDLYSCFPAAVRMQQREMGLVGREVVTVTGGMPFAGGPLNNYALGSTVAMARLLRADAGASGLVTSVSGMVTKQGAGVWSATPPAGGFRWADVSPVVEELPVDDRAGGRGVVAGYTMWPEPELAALRGHDAWTVAAIVSMDDGTRNIATIGDLHGRSDEWRAREWVGRPVHVHDNILVDLY